MKKISSILIIVILCNFIFSGFVYADNDVDDSTITYSGEAYNDLLNGKVSVNNQEEEVSETTSSAGSMVGTQTSAVASFFVLIATFMRIIAGQGGYYYTESEYSAENVGWFTINSLVFGEYLLFNVNVYQTNASLNPDVAETNVSNVMDSIKEMIATFFQVIRLFAIALILILLMYTFLRLIVSDLAEDRARYKEVLKAWVIGLIFIFGLPYIIAIINTICDYILDVLWDARLALEETGYKSFEIELFLQCLNGTANTGGLKSAAYFIEFLAFMIMYIKFFAKYIKRSFKVFMLVVFAPIIGILHVFSKIKGGKGKIGTWVSQYVSNLLMQPLHALIYLVFMFVAGNIVLNAPLLAVLFLWALSRAEKIIEIILEIDYGKLSSLFSNNK